MLTLGFKEYLMYLDGHFGLPAEYAFISYFYFFDCSVCSFTCLFIYLIPTLMFTHSFCSFRSDPVGQSTSVATQELLRVVEGNPDGLPTLDPVRDLHLRDMDMVEDFRRLDMLRDLLPSFQCINDPSFRENVSSNFAY